MEHAHAHPKDGLPAAECKQTLVQLNFSGSNKVTNIAKVNPTTSYYNYFLGKKHVQK